MMPTPHVARRVDDPPFRTRLPRPPWQVGSKWQVTVAGHGNETTLAHRRGRPAATQGKRGHDRWGRKRGPTGRPSCPPHQTNTACYEGCPRNKMLLITAVQGWPTATHARASIMAADTLHRTLPPPAAPTGYGPTSSAWLRGQELRRGAAAPLWKYQEEEERRPKRPWIPLLC